MYSTSVMSLSVSVHTGASTPATADGLTPGTRVAGSQA